MSYILEKEEKRNVAGNFDIIVVGGGCAGLGAAMGAAKAESNVALIERWGFLGGMLTAGYVWGIPWYEMRVCGGIVKELTDRLLEAGGIIDPFDPTLDELRAKGEWTGAPFTPTDMEVDKHVLQKMCTEAGVKIFLHTYFGDAIIENNTIKGIFVQNKSGRVAILGKMVIDCTGDGDVFASAGAPFDYSGTASKTETHEFVMGNVQTNKARGYMKIDPNMKKAVAIARKKGDLSPSTGIMRWTLPTTGIARFEEPTRISIESRDFLPKFWRKNEAHVWAAHTQTDILSGEGVTEGEVKSREQIWEISRFLIKYVPGFEQSYIQDSAISLGLRESRRVIGEYVVQTEDIGDGRRFDDEIVKSTVWEFPDNIFYLPYRCIVPKKIDNLLVGGRCVSLTHEAFNDHVSPRDEATCMVLGQAAAVAAALCVKKNITPRNLDIRFLQEELIKQGFPADIIHRPGLPPLRPGWKRP